MAMAHMADLGVGKGLAAARLDELLFSTNRLPHIIFTDESLQIPEVKSSSRKRVLKMSQVRQ